MHVRVIMLQRALRALQAPWQVRCGLQPARGAHLLYQVPQYCLAGLWL